MARLFIVYLGGAQAAGRFGEDHEVVVAAADGQTGAMRKARGKWKGVGKAHVDRIMEVKTVDGFDISLAKNKKDAADVLEERRNDYSK